MKTREEFVLLVNAYRKEAAWRDLFFVIGLIILTLAPFLITFSITRGIGHRAAGWILIAMWVATTVFVSIYKVQSTHSLARKLELICPACSRALMNDLKLATATHNCPYCGSRVFS